MTVNEAVAHHSPEGYESVSHLMAWHASSVGAICHGMHTPIALSAGAHPH